MGGGYGLSLSGLPPLRFTSVSRFPNGGTPMVGIPLEGVGIPLAGGIPLRDPASSRVPVVEFQWFWRFWDGLST